jgi:hypothetical protein
LAEVPVRTSFAEVPFMVHSGCQSKASKFAGVLVSVWADPSGFMVQTSPPLS